MGFDAGSAAFERGDYAAALAEWGPAAEAGGADSQNGMGLLYLGGKGVPKDEAEAFRWFTKAAEQGFPKAWLNLGVAYRDGSGVPKDVSRGVELIRRSAESGLAAAQMTIGLMHKQGKGVDQDYAAGVDWTRKAADQGHAGAQYNLGLWYNLGEVIEKDMNESLRWLRSAADQGNVRALRMLGDMFLEGDDVDVDPGEAARWFVKLAEKGDAYGQYRLGCAYLRGTGLDQDDHLAREWLNRSAEQGHPDALFELAQASLEERGATYSKGDYFSLISRAADKGSEEAQYPYRTTRWATGSGAPLGQAGSPTRPRLNDFVCSQDSKVIHGHDPRTNEFEKSSNPFHKIVKLNPPLLAYAMALYDGDIGRCSDAYARSIALFGEADMDPERELVRGDARVARARQAAAVCEFNDSAAYVLTVYYRDIEENWELCLYAATRYLSVHPGNKHARFLAGASATQLEWWPEAVDLLDPVVSGGMLGLGQPEVVYDSARYFVWSLVYWLRMHFKTNPTGLVGLGYGGRISPFERLNAAVMTFNNYSRMTATTDVERQRDAEHKERMVSAVGELYAQAKREGRLDE